MSVYKDIDFATQQTIFPENGSNMHAERQCARYSFQRPMLAP